MEQVALFWWGHDGNRLLGSKANGLVIKGRKEMYHNLIFNVNTEQTEWCVS